MFAIYRDWGIVDIDTALGIFSEERERAKKLFCEYSMEETGNECLEYQEKTVVRDQQFTTMDARVKLKKLYPIVG